ncbi:MAG: hypothetical protein KJ067_11390 [Vicinamibacteria bacterium]|nr:hypothetical protein [Vicinamibacteria bacterium]
MSRVHVEIEPQALARAASGAPGLSLDAVVHAALHEYAARRVLKAHAAEAARRLAREQALAAGAPPRPVS